MAGQTGSKILDRVDRTFDDKVDKIINEKLLERCNTTFDKAIDTFVDRAFNVAMQKFDADAQPSEENKEEEEALQEKKDARIQRLEKARERLRDYGLPQLLLDAMEQEGWLDERNWEILTKDQLQAMGFGDGHIELFMEGINKNKQAKKSASDKLKRWHIPQSIINVMDEEGYLDEAKWEGLRQNALYWETIRAGQLDNKVYIPYEGTDLKLIGFEYKHIESFLHGMEKIEEANKPPEFILAEWGIPAEAIETMRKNRVLAEENWEHLTDKKLKELGMKLYIRDFKDGLARRIKQKDQKIEDLEDTAQADEAIRAWGIPPVLVDRMRERGWIHAEFWDDLLEHEYELEQLGFHNGHISTFKRKFQEWKEEQDSKATQRKMKLLRKLEKPPKKQSTLLKRHIDVFNAMDEPVKIRIRGERRYGSFESSLGSQSQQKDKQSLRKHGKIMHSKNKSIQDSTGESTSDSTTQRGFKVGASAQVAATPVNAALNVEASKKDTLSTTNKATQHAENERESQRRLEDERSNQLSDASAMTEANTSQHSWEKVTVGFTNIMPNQTIEFPVQISNPNSVVYMTIYSFSELEPICDNVQIDANYIKIDKVTIEGFGAKIRWQPSLKPRKTKGAGTDHEAIAAKNGFFTIFGFCNYLEKQAIGGKKVQFIKNILGNSKYDVSKKDEMMHLDAQLKQVLAIYTQKNEVSVAQEEEVKNEEEDMENEQKAKQRHEQQRIKRENDLILRCVETYLNTTQNKTVIKFDGELDKHADQKQGNAHPTTNIKRIDGVLEILKMRHFLQNKGIARNEKIDFITESLGGDDATYILTDDTKKSLNEQIKGIITVSDNIDELRKQKHQDITLTNYPHKIEEYKGIIEKMKQFMEEHTKHSAKYEPFRGHRDLDSDDEELHAVEKFFDCDSHALLKGWGLSQFHERMVDEGWQNPLDWVHLDENILKQNIGFRPGHIQIFNRKFDLWVKRYNDVRRTIDPKQKGKHGVLIVGKDETTTLKSNFLYIFTKVIIREGATLTVQPWSPKQRDGGVLFIKCHQDIILEKNARISVDGKGYWGSAKPDKMGFGPGGGGSVGYSCNGAGGASYCGEGLRGYNIAEDEDIFTKEQIEEYKRDPKETVANHKQWICWEDLAPQAGDDDQDGDDDPWKGERGALYWDVTENGRSRYFVKTKTELQEKTAIESLECLAIDIRKSFGSGDVATQEAKNTHRQALGSGGGCGIEIHKSRHGWEFRPKRGGAGGGAVRIMCDRLIMYNGSRITAKGNFDPYGDPFSAGGSGGSIFITVTSAIIPKNRNPNNKNINLFARGGGQWEMDKMYLPQTWTEKEETALKAIRTFEKLKYPRLQIERREEQEKEKNKRIEARKKPDYIDSDDDDDESDDFWDDSDNEEDDDAVEATFDIDAFCTYLEKHYDYIQKDEVALIKQRLLRRKNLTRWIIDDVKNKESKKKTLGEMLKAFEVVFVDWPKRQFKRRNECESELLQHQGMNAKVSSSSATAVDAPLNVEMHANDLLKNVLKHVQVFYLDLEEAAVEKAELQKLPIAVQIAMLKHEYKEETKNTEDDKIKEEDLWLWKWKKMPKMPPMQQVAGDNESVNCDNEAVREEKEEESEIKKEKGKYDSKVLNLVFGDCLKRDEESGLFDSKARADWEWVGIGGHGVVRVDYHSPFTIGWDRCRPRAFLGTDVDDGNTGDEPQVTEFSKTFTQQYN
eukprot:437952_1